MSDQKPSPSAGPPRGGSVLDPNWEDELRSGQEAEGEAGSVDAELAFVHLLRHTREPEALAPDQLDSIWAAIEGELEAAPGGVPWWRKAWIWWSAPALAAAAVLVVVVVGPKSDDTSIASKSEDRSAEQRSAKPAPGSAAIDEAREGAPAPAELALAEPAKDAAETEDAGDRAARGLGGATGSPDTATSSDSRFEVSFAKLAPNGRLAIRVGVEQSRDELRSQLLAKARGEAR